MKLNTLNAGIAGCLLAVAISGCDKSNDAMDAAKKSADSATTAVQQGADKAVTEVKQAGEKAVTEVKQAGEKAVGNVAEQAKAATGGEATAVIAKVQGLVAEKKYQEALTALGGLKDLKLSDTQQKVVDGLKEQIQKLMSGDAGKAVGNLLGK